MSLHFDPPLSTTQPHETDRFFDAVQTLVPPGYRIAQVFDTWPALLESELPKQYAVTVRYRGVQTGQEYEVVHRLDAEALRYRFIGRNKGVNEIAEELERVRKSMEERLSGVERGITKLGEGAYHVRDARDCREAVQRLTGFWHIQRAIRDAPAASLPFRRTLDTVRADLISLFRVTDWTGLRDDQREALGEAARVVFDRNAEVIGHTKEWRAQVDTAVERLAASFA
jgi:hypothetical protein